MDSRADFQRLLDDMDKVIKRKQLELNELDERLEATREQLNEKESQLAQLEASQAAKQATNDQSAGGSAAAKFGAINQNQLAIDEFLLEQRREFQQQLAKLNEELVEYETINRDLVKQNELLKSELNQAGQTSEQLRAQMHILVANLEETQSANFELNMRLAKAEASSQAQQRLLKRTHEQDKVLMDAVNDKLESTKRAILARDDEIKRLKADNQFLLRTLGVEINFSDNEQRQGDYNQDGDVVARGALASSKLDNGANLEPLCETGQIEYLARSALTNEIIGDGGPNDTRGAGSDGTPSERRRLFIERMVAQVYREKDSQIQLLKSQLLQATKDLESNANLIEDLTSSQKSSRLLANGRQISESGSHGRRVAFNDEPIDLIDCRANDNVEEVSIKRRCEMLETELEAKDTQLRLIEFRIHQYEVILPDVIVDLIERLRSMKGDDTELRTVVQVLVENLVKVLHELGMSQQLLDQIAHLNELNATKDVQIERLVVSLNRLDAKLNSLQDRQQQLSGDQEEFLESFFEEKLANLDQRLELKGEANLDHESQEESNSKDSTANDTSRVVGSEQKSQLEKEHSAQKEKVVREDDALQQLKEPPAARESPPPKERPNSVLSRDPELGDDDGIPTDRLINENLDYEPPIELTPISELKPDKEPTSNSSIEGPPDNSRDRLRLLEDENRLLELAMKEILMSIRWSDSQCSTILIDCPSLERLCQLIEARFLTSSVPVGCRVGPECPEANDQRQVEAASTKADGETPGAEPTNDYLFQLIIMKSELDLIRGQNEQLRSELKLQRREYQDLIRPECASDQPSTTSPPSATDAQCQTGDTSASVADQGYIDKNFPLGSQLLLDKLGPRDKCSSCARLTRIANHLLECIVKIETRVSLSDETFINRLVGLYQLTERLGRDLLFRENCINQLVRKCNLLARQKYVVQSRAQSLESRFNAHSKVCPIMSHYDLRVRDQSGASRVTTSLPIAPASAISFRQGNYLEAKPLSRLEPTHKNFVHSTPHKSAQTSPDCAGLSRNDMTIRLLTSIINSLKSMLDFKDERIGRLERMLLVGSR